jgi:tRNA(adenine34) deaminase
MKLALKEANKSLKNWEVPVGCIIVKDDIVIAKGHNNRETAQSVLGHAEINAIKSANKKLGSWKLDGCSIFVTLEPCVMCLGTIIQARIKNLFFGTRDPRNGFVISAIDISSIPFTHKLNIEEGILEDECSNIITSFFKDLRIYKQKEEQ